MTSGKAAILVIAFVAALCVPLFSFLAGSPADSQPWVPRPNRVWSIHLYLEPCGADIERVIVHLPGDDSLGYEEVESKRDFMVFQWEVVLKKEKTPVGELLCRMGQRIYQVTIIGKFTLEDRRFVRNIWISPYGVAIRKIGPAPKWHGISAPSREWTAQFTDWLKCHEKYRENFAELFGRLKYKVDSRMVIHLSVIGAGCGLQPKPKGGAKHGLRPGSC